jgi:hypothetical protein
MLKEKAKHFGDETGVTDFKYSNGWLQRFLLTHFGIKRFQPVIKKYHSHPCFFVGSVIGIKIDIEITKTSRFQSLSNDVIMDNAPSHSVPNLSNVEIHFLPPTTTSHLQPLDAGIIQCFKGHYRRQHLRHLVDCIDNDVTATVHLHLWCSLGVQLAGYLYFVQQVHYEPNNLRLCLMTLSANFTGRFRCEYN